MEWHTTRKKLKTVLKEIGFEEKRRYFVSAETEFFIEFPAGPLAVGNEPVEKLAELQFETGKLRLLSPLKAIKQERPPRYSHGSKCQQFIRHVRDEVKYINITTISGE